MFAIRFNDVDFTWRRQTRRQVFLCVAKPTYADEMALFAGAADLERVRVIAIEANRFRGRRRSMLQEQPLFRLDLSLELAHGRPHTVPPCDLHERLAVIAPSPRIMDRPR